MENTAAIRNEDIRRDEGREDEGREGVSPRSGCVSPETGCGPPVTVVIPVYNGEAFIGETVDSVLRQTHRNLRVLCLIDGTKDRSRAIIESFGDPRVSVFERENRGAVYRRNEGLEMADSEYLWFLDHDDVLYPDCIETALRVMEEQGADAVAVSGHLIDAEGRIIRRLYRFRKPSLTLDRLCRGNELFTTGQVLIKKSALVAVGGFNEGAGSAVDWDLWIRLAKRGCKLVFADRYLMGYRVHAHNDSKDARKMLQGELHILRDTLHMFGPPGKFESYAYLRYSSRAKDWKALLKALHLNASLLFHPRFCLAVLQIAMNHATGNDHGQTITEG